MRIINIPLTICIFIVSLFIKCSPSDNVDKKGVDKIDSTKLVKVKPVTWDSLIKEFIIMDSLDQKYRQVDWKSASDPNLIAQCKIDSINTKRILEIIQIYGYPTAEKLNKKVNACIILLHAPECFFATLDSLVEIENKKDSIWPEEYKMIKWQIKGRPGQEKHQL